MSLNKVILIGRLGRDPEVRYMPNGEAVCNFSVATSESWNDKQSGNKVERTEWHNITLYRKLAEIAGKYLKKGSQVYIEGRIQSRKYTDKMGVERTAYEIIGNDMQMLGSRNDNGGGTASFDPAYDNGGSGYSPNYGDRNDSYPTTNTQPEYTTPAAPQQRKAPIAPAAPVDDIDDDIPF